MKEHLRKQARGPGETGQNPERSEVVSRSAGGREIAGSIPAAPTNFGRYP